VAAVVSSGKELMEEEVKMSDESLLQSERSG
jgi:hypothetical protein